jgi:hypothetical protein
MIKSKKMRWAGHVASIGRRILVEKPEEMIPLGRPRHRWEEKIVTKEKEIHRSAF